MHSPAPTPLRPTRRLRLRGALADLVLSVVLVAAMAGGVIVASAPAHAAGGPGVDRGADAAALSPRC